MRKLIAIPALLMLALFMNCGAKQEATLSGIQAPRGQVVGDQETGYQLILQEQRDTVIWFCRSSSSKSGHDS